MPTRIAVYASEVPDVPADHVVIGDDLASMWDIDPAERRPWRFDPVVPQPVRRIVLELPTERDPVDAAREVAHAGLAGALLWIPDTGADVFVPVNGVPHRVREIDISRGGGLVCLTKDSVVELYASSVRAGVDIVVLADISNSMTVDDIPAAQEGPGYYSRPNHWITRIDALKRALLDMLDIRLQVSGRVSRLALLEFNQNVQHKFPRTGGMTQLDGSSPEALVMEFRHAVAVLRPDGVTDIGNALHAAANVLYQDGHPGNEKLIVLVSDGANWTPTGDQGTGEVVHTVQEPVSLVAHLHRDVGIRLHAIGISTAELFYRRGIYQPNEAIVPNHALLEELVKVGGGDPTTVGGLDVLADYFAGLGAGILHRVGERLTEPARPGPLPERTRAALERLRAIETIEWDRRRDELRDRLSDLFIGCNDEATRVYGRPIWRPLTLQQLLSRELGRPVTDVKAFASSLSRGLAVTRTEPQFAPLCGLLGELAGTDIDYEALSTLTGAAVDSPMSAQVLLMQRVHDLTDELRVRLADMRPEGRDEHEPDRPSVTSRFTYRD
ncbi:vWA domain-containing protein [Nocardia sp. NPDC059246]|uniref:vWA domain-containing protein n=1 Tax=unclassified Nocardia TaxID=2637762 RepID=UPI00367A4681